MTELIPDGKEAVGLEAGKEESLRGLAGQRTLCHFRGGNQDGGIPLFQGGVLC